VPILHVRGVPASLYAELRSLASDERRSLSAEVLVLLEEGVREARRRTEQGRILDALARRRKRRPAAGPGDTSTDWIRAARDGDGEPAAAPRSAVTSRRRR
jgi:hypothetical protein